MPPKRKSLESTDPNAAPRPSAKKAKSSARQSEPETDPQLEAFLSSRASRWSAVSASKNLDANYWMTNKNPAEAYRLDCICSILDAPTDEEDDDDDEDEEDDEDDDDDEGDNGEGAPKPRQQKKKSVCDGGKTCPCFKPASDHPGHLYVVTSAGLTRHLFSGNMMSFRTPDYFDMHTFNDHSAYGAVEVMQNLLLDFDEAFMAKQWREAWTVVEGLGMFMLVGAGSEMAMADDGDMVRRTAEQIIRMVLTGLAFHQREICPEGRAGDDLNVGHIIAIYLRLADQFRDAGLLDEASASKAKTFSFRGSNLDLYLRGWAQRNNIAVPEAEITSEDGNITLPSTSNKDSFGWSKSFADYSRT